MNGWTTTTIATFIVDREAGTAIKFGDELFFELKFHITFQGVINTPVNNVELWRDGRVTAIVESTTLNFDQRSVIMLLKPIDFEGDVAKLNELVAHLIGVGWDVARQ